MCCFSRGPGFPFAVALLAFALAGTASAQLVTENAGTLSPETPMARLLIKGADWANVSEYSAVGEFHLGLHKQFEASLVVPVLYKRFRIEGRRESAAGFGDVAINGKLNVYKEDGVMTSLRVAVFGGIEFPTGNWKDTLDGETVPYARKLQLGSGTFNFRLGTGVTYVSDRHRIAGDVYGRLCTSRDGVSPGPRVRVDAAYWYRLFPAVFAPGEAGMELRLVVDASYIHIYHTRGEDLNDSGDQLWLAPGAQFFATTWLHLEGNVALPLFDTTHDQYGHARWAAFIAVKFLF